MGSTFSVVSNLFKETNKITSETASAKTNLGDPPTNALDSFPGHNPPQDDSSFKTELEEQSKVYVLIVGGVFLLLVNAPQSPITRVLAYRIHLLSLILSFLSWIVSFYLPRSPASPHISRLHNQVLTIALVSIAISVFTRTYIELSSSIEWYDFFILIVLAAGTGVYLRYGWMTAKNPEQTSSADPASATNRV
jgi:hypothetical protein